MEKVSTDGHPLDRSGTFWHGVASIVGIQKSSAVDYSVSTVLKQKIFDDELQKVRTVHMKI